MKEFKGTPGPWVLLEAGDRITNKVPVDRGNTSILTIVEEDGVKFAAVYEDEDAHLIAAAPDLLEALQAFEESANLWLPSYADEVHLHEAEALHQLRQKALDAIAKALGEHHE